jgi:hypothetical protein
MGRDYALLLSYVSNIFIPSRPTLCGPKDPHSSRIQSGGTPPNYLRPWNSSFLVTVDDRRYRIIKGRPLE